MTLRSALFSLLILLAPAFAPATVHAENRVVQIEPVVRDGRLYIDANVEFTLGDELRHAMEKGVPVFFTADLDIVRKRWWWFDDTVVSTQQTWKIVYNALTRQWRIGTGDLSLPEPSLDDALSLVRHVRGWAVAQAGDLPRDADLHGRLRLRLDTSLLARPFQIDAFNSREWVLATPWKNFTFSVETGPSDPS